MSVSGVMAPVSTRARENCEKSYHPGCGGLSLDKRPYTRPFPFFPTTKSGSHLASHPAAHPPHPCGASGAPAGAAPPASTGLPYVCGDTLYVRDHPMPMRAPHASRGTLYNCPHGAARGESCPSARTYDPSPHISLTPLVADGRNVGLLVVPARSAPRIPDAPDAVAGCTESDVSGAGRPARGPPTTCPAPGAAAYPAPVRSAASC